MITIVIGTKETTFFPLLCPSRHNLFGTLFICGHLAQYIGTGTNVKHFDMSDRLGPLFWDGQNIVKKQGNDEKKKKNHKNYVGWDKLGPLILGWPRESHWLATA